jgi:hypothetical protein
MQAALFPLALNELLGGAQLSPELDGDELISSSVSSSSNFICFQFRRLTLGITRAHIQG